MQREVLQNKAVYLMRVNSKGVGEATFEADIALGEIPLGTLEAFRALLADLYLPVLTEQGQWGASTDQQTQTFLKVQWHTFSMNSFPNIPQKIQLPCASPSRIDMNCPLMRKERAH